MYKWTDGTELYHHGIKGQKWGVRRFQKADGTLTPEGRKRAKKFSLSDMKFIGKKDDFNKRPSRKLIENKDLNKILPIYVRRPDRMHGSREYAAKRANDPFWYKKAVASKSFEANVYGVGREMDIQDRVDEDMVGLENRNERIEALRWLTEDEYAEYLENKWAIELAYEDLKNVGDPKTNRRLSAEMERNRDMLSKNEKDFKRKIAKAALNSVKKETRVHGNAKNRIDNVN